MSDELVDSGVGDEKNEKPQDTIDEEREISSEKTSPEIQPVGEINVDPDSKQDFVDSDAGEKGDLLGKEAELSPEEIQQKGASTSTGGIKIEEDPGKLLIEEDKSKPGIEASKEGVTEKESAVSQYGVVMKDSMTISLGDESGQETYLGEDAKLPEFKRVSLQESFTDDEFGAYRGKFQQPDPTLASIVMAELDYTFPTRMGDERDERRSVKVSGDFTAYPSEKSPLVLLRTFSKDYFEMDIDEEDVHTLGSQIFSERPKKEHNKKNFQQKNLELKEDLGKLRIRNWILTRALILYFKKHRLDYAPKEYDTARENIINYKSKLEELYDRQRKFEFSQSVILNDINNVRKKRAKRLEDLNTNFESFQKRETDLAKGLVFRKSGQVLHEKTVTRLITRQKNYFTNLCGMRLQWYMIRDQVDRKEVEINNLNVLGNGLSLAGYEALKEENRICVDRLEEKDEELNRLRARQKLLTQMLAHVREKSFALDSDMEDLIYDLFNSESEIDYLRRGLNVVKQERDTARQQLEKLKIESGLLSETALLSDMETSLKEYQIYKKELTELQESYATATKQLRNLRKTRERLEVTLKSSTPKVIIRKPKKKAAVCKVRPSIMYPAVLPFTFSRDSPSTSKAVLDTNFAPIVHKLSGNK